MTGSCPLVTCMTVSQPPRLRQLKAAIRDFCRQSWPRRELLIVVDDPDYARRVDRMIERMEGDIYLLNYGQRSTLGKLRNLALEQAHGDFVCQWDDDDRYSPERIRLQAEAIIDSEASACFLYEQLHYFESTQQLFWTDWRRCDGTRRVQAPLSWIPGTVLFRRGRARYPEWGALSSRGEDSALAFSLWREAAIAIETPPGTYLRTFHGNNTWHWKHHFSLAVRRSKSARTVCAQRAELEGAAQRFELGPSLCMMAGSEPAFQS